MCKYYLQNYSPYIIKIECLNSKNNLMIEIYYVIGQKYFFKFISRVLFILFIFLKKLEFIITT